MPDNPSAPIAGGQPPAGFNQPGPSTQSQATMMPMMYPSKFQAPRAMYCCPIECHGKIPQPYHLPGYAGHIPTKRSLATFGRISRDVIEDPCVSQAPCPILAPPGGECCPRDPCMRNPVGCEDIGCCDTVCCPPVPVYQKPKKPPCPELCCDPCKIMECFPGQSPDCCQPNPGCVPPSSCTPGCRPGRLNCGPSSSSRGSPQPMSFNFGPSSSSGCGPSSGSPQSVRFNCGPPPGPSRNCVEELENNSCDNRCCRPCPPPKKRGFIPSFRPVIYLLLCLVQGSSAVLTANDEAAISHFVAINIVQQATIRETLYPEEVARFLAPRFPLATEAELVHAVIMGMNQHFTLTLPRTVDFGLNAHYRGFILNPNGMFARMIPQGAYPTPLDRIGRAMRQNLPLLMKLVFLLLLIAFVFFVGHSIGTLSSPLPQCPMIPRCPSCDGRLQCICLAKHE